MVWVGGGLWDHLGPTPCCGRGRLPLDRVARGPVQPGLGCFRGEGTRGLSGRPVPVSHHPHSEWFLPHI